MHAALKLVYRYRQLFGKCESSAGLEFDEIRELAALEAFFAGDESAPPSRELGGSRLFAREAVDADAALRARDRRAPIRLLDLGPGGFACRGAFSLEPRERVELTATPSPGGILSYRFRAELAWIIPTQVGAYAGFRFLGTPLELRHSAASRSAESPPTPGARARRSELAPRA